MANLPYNVATPLVLRTLVEVPAVAHLLVMVQREVGERMAAAAGEDPYGAVSVRIAYFARAEVVGRVPASVFVPRPRVESVLVRLERRPEPAVDPALVSYDRLNAGRPGRLRPAAQDAAALPGRGGRPGGLRAGRRAARRPGRGARRGGLGQAGGPVTDEPVTDEPGTAAPRQALAPAKLTVSLQVTGVRPDGYHELLRRDGHARPGRRARGRPRRVRAGRGGRAGDPGRRPAGPRTTWSSGPWPPAGGGPGCA